MSRICGVAARARSAGRSGRRRRNVTYSAAGRGEAERDLARSDPRPPRAARLVDRAQPTQRRARSASSAARTGRADRGTSPRTRPGRGPSPTASGHPAGPSGPAGRRGPPASASRRARDRRTPARAATPNARCSRAVCRSIIAIARAWPVAPSSAERMTWARNGSDRIASIVVGGSSPTATARPSAM